MLSGKHSYSGRGTGTSCSNINQHTVDRPFKNLNHPGTGDFKPTTLTCALFTLKLNIKSPTVIIL
jgi:hypothetical protein